jgi:hypothetical protein
VSKALRPSTATPAVAQVSGTFGAMTMICPLRPAGKIDGSLIEPFQLQLWGLLRYREVEKKNKYDRLGINVGTHQITLADMDELKCPDFAKSFDSTEWKLPEKPEEPKEILALIKSQ